MPAKWSTYFEPEASEFSPGNGRAIGGKADAISVEIVQLESIQSSLGASKAQKPSAAPEQESGAAQSEERTSEDNTERSESQDQGQDEQNELMKAMESRISLMSKLTMEAQLSSKLE